MRRKILSIFVFFIGTITHSQIQVNTVKGTVSDGDSPISNANISIKNTDRGVSTGQDGKYEIEVSPGQELVFRYVGFETIEIIIEDVTRILNIELSPKIEELDEVIVKGREIRRSQQELFEDYNIDNEIVRTANGFLNRRSLGFSSKFFQGNQLNPGAIDIIQALNFLIPGSFITEGRDGIILNRSRGSLVSNTAPALWDVDGLITRQAPFWLSPAQIERVVVIGSTLSTNFRYGNLGLGGVIIVNTKLINFSPDGKVIDRARLKDNIFEQGSTISIYDSGTPAYLEALRNSQNRLEATALFEKQRAFYGNFQDYLLDAFDYFSTTWNNQTICNTIADIIESDFSDNPVALKSLAYMMESRKDYKSAERVYKKVFVLRPSYAQSYMDLANIYRISGKIRNAASLYARYDYLVDQSYFESSENFVPILARDFHNLVVLNKKKLKSDGQKKLDVREAEFKGTRLVFEWSDSEAEFELQFVNPEQQYHTWKYTRSNNKDRIKDGKRNGYSSEEYLIYAPYEGTWTINVNYLGNKRLTSTYLKATIYHNYGTNQQRQETKVFKLRLREANQKLFSIDDSVLYAAN